VSKEDTQATVTIKRSTGGVMGGPPLNDVARRGAARLDSGESAREETGVLCSFHGHGK